MFHILVGAIKKKAIIHDLNIVIESLSLSDIENQALKQTQDNNQQSRSLHKGKGQTLMKYNQSICQKLINLLLTYEVIILKT